MKKETINEDKVRIVRVDMPGLQYDINAIVRAFYPDKEVRVLEPGEKVRDVSLLDLPVYMDVSIMDSDDVIPASPEEHPDIIFVNHTDQVAGNCEYGTIRVEDRTYRYEIDPELGAKNSFKLALYDVMVEVTGRTLPWGNLTGVRPTKIAMTKMKQGMSDDEIIGYMKVRHKVSDVKANLALDIAHREDTLLKRIDHEHGYSLYIDIPFCPTTCLYCSFTSYPYAAWKKRIDEYLDALFKEIDYVSENIVTGTDITQERDHTRADQGETYHGAGLRSGLCGYPDTIYIGGGTPTSLDEEHLERLLKYLTERIDVSKSLEFTCEAGRPDSITPGKLEIMKRYGVTRISINPQTMQQKTLDIIGRKTTPGQVTEAFLMAREAGFDNINMDIILGLPGEGVAEVSDTLGQISALKPDSLTVHSLAIKRASALKQHLDEIGIEALQNTEETMRLAREAAQSLGMEPYYLYRQKNMSGNFENTGYAIPGKEGLYNILIMEEVQSIVALGAGAISKRVDYEMPDSDESAGEDSDESTGTTPLAIRRCENPKDIDNYISRIDEMIRRKKELFEDVV